MYVPDKDPTQQRELEAQGPDAQLTADNNEMPTKFYGKHQNIYLNCFLDK
jgi:hypothetical protein